MELSRSYREAIERCPQQSDLDGSGSYQAYRNSLNGSRNCRAPIEPDSQKPRWIEIAITAIEKRSSRGLIDSLAIERCWEAVEIAQKQFFKKKKYTNMNAIKHATQPKIQITFWTLQNIYQLEKCQEFRSKTHTHPKQV